MKKMDDKTTFFITLLIIAIFLTAAYPYISEVGQFTKDVIILPPTNIAPHAIFSINVAKITVGTTVVFDAIDSYDEDGEIVSYEWNVGAVEEMIPIDIEPIESDKEVIIEEPPGINPPLEPGLNLAAPVDSIDPPEAELRFILFEWDFDGDGTIDWSSTDESIITYIYNTEGTYTATFSATDSNYETGTDTVVINVLDQEIPLDITTDSSDSVDSIDSSSSTGAGGGGGTGGGLIQEVVSQPETIAETGEVGDVEAEVTNDVEQREVTPLTTLFFITLVTAVLVVIYVMYRSGKFKSKK